MSGVDGKEERGAAGEGTEFHGPSEYEAGGRGPSLVVEEPVHLFEGYGIELEYMIVDRDRLDVHPVTDRVLEAVAGRIETEIEMGELAWSNELVLHVIELKTNGPADRLQGLAETFYRDLTRIGEILKGDGGRLMPTAMHPWMDPYGETKLWPHEYNAVYEAFNRIFDCRGHGWSNLQSMHINLPFTGDEEFGRLHAAIRLVLPILPALAASSPVQDGRVTGTLDSRLAAYSVNCARIPSLTGEVIPEPVFTKRDYEGGLLGGLYRDIAPHDPDGVLQFEWLNARGAIARFDRDTIEIRVIDIQECPRADLAIAAATVGAVKLLCAERWGNLASQQAWPVEPLAAFLRRAIVDGERAVIDDARYLAAFGYPGISATAGDLWRHIVPQALEALDGDAAEFQEPLQVILEHGTLSRRILDALGERPSKADLASVYGRLCDCLDGNRMFVP